MWFFYCLNLIIYCRCIFIFFRYTVIFFRCAALLGKRFEKLAKLFNFTFCVKRAAIHTINLILISIEVCNGMLLKLN